MPPAGVLRAADRDTIATTGLWRIADDRLVPVDRAYAGPTTVLVPTERVLVLTVDLPFATRRQRAAAAPFAVEGLIAQPLDQVHVALGTEIGDRRHLVGVVEHRIMAAWIGLLEAAGLSAAVLVPDALTLPLPPSDAWRIAIEGGRGLVRQGDGGGFALDADGLEMAWTAAGRPRLVGTATDLPEALRQGVEETTFELHDDRPAIVTPPLDLRQGAYAARRVEVERPARTLALILAAGAVAHLGIIGVDTWALDRAADKAEAATRALLAERAPALANEPDLTLAVDQAAPVVVGDGPFLTAVNRSAGAMTGQGIAWRGVTYSAAEPLELAIAAPDAAALDRVTAAMTASGLQARARLDPQVAAGDLGGVNAALSVEQPGGGR